MLGPQVLSRKGVMEPNILEQDLGPGPGVSRRCLPIVVIFLTEIRYVFIKWIIPVS